VALVGQGRLGGVVEASGHPPVGVAQASAARWQPVPGLLPSSFCWHSAGPLTPFSSCRPIAVGHPVEPLPDVRRADARTAKIRGPHSIAQCFQVKAYSGEPFTTKLARNLLAKDCWRATLLDEPQELGPEVAAVGGAFTLAGG
jgi:hypothetical protein